MNELPPWIEAEPRTPEKVLAWLTNDPLTGCNLGEVVAADIVRVLAENGFKIVPV